MKKSLIIMLSTLWCFLYLNSNVFASSALDSWQYYKEITSSKSDKYKAVFLNDEVYRYSKSDLADLRVVDSKGKFISYYLVRGYSNENKVNILYASILQSKHKEKNTTIFNFKITPLKENTDSPTNRLSLETDQNKYLKNIEILGSFDGTSWETIKNDTIYKVENISRKEISLDKTLKYSFYRIKVFDNLDNLEITSLTLIHNNIDRIEENYQKVLPLAYDIKTQGKTSLVNIKNPNKMKVKNLQLSIDGTFNRYYEVNAKVGESFNPTGTSGDLYKLNFKDFEAVNTDIRFSPYLMDSDVIQVKIFNKDDSPLAIKIIKATCVLDKVVFEGSSTEKYKLYFGNLNATAPSYDIETYKQHIENESQEKCSLEKLVTNQVVKEIKENKNKDYLMYVFNIVLGILSVVLIVILARKLKAKNR